MQPRLRDMPLRRDDPSMFFGGRIWIHTPGRYAVEYEDHYDNL